MGFFLVMIGLTVVAIIRAKKADTWIWYGLGVGLQLLSLIGLTRKYAKLGYGNAVGGTWAVFFVIAVVGLIIILIRRKK